MLLTHKKKRDNKSRLKRKEWYASKSWKVLARLHRRANPFCVECQKQNILTDCSPGTNNGVTDHRVPVSSGKTREEQFKLMFDELNLQTLCHKHHNQKSGKEGHGII